MTDRRTILPPQTTPLERAVDQTAPEWGWLAEGVEPRCVWRNPDFTPWLAVDWGVARFAPYFNTAQELLDAALPWLRQRGTAASVRTVLGWLGWFDIVLEQDGAWLHLDPGRIVAHAELPPMAHVVRASIPAHVKFYRVFHGYDLRPVRTDAAARIDFGLLDDDSGVFVDVSPYGEPVKVSQGVTHGGVAGAPLPGRAQGAHTVLHTSVATYTFRLLLDAWRLDGEVLTASSGGHTVLHSAISNAPARITPLWPPPARARSGQCPWAAPPPRGARTVTHTGMAGRPHENGRTWTGRWDGAPWRQSFPSRVTFITE